MEIVRAIKPKDLKKVKTLLSEYFQWLNEVHDLEIDRKAIEQELSTLPGGYAQPDGCLLIAYDDSEAAGCGALLAINKEVCEMKRMYVRPAFQGKGIGRKIVQRLIEEADNIGYKRIRICLNTFMYTAQALYRSLGFYETEPETEFLEDIRNQKICMELDLNK